MYKDLQELSERYQEVIDLSLPFCLKSNQIFLRKLLLTFPFLQSIDLSDELFNRRLTSFLALEADDFLNFSDLEEDQFITVYHQFQNLQPRQKILILFLNLHTQHLDQQSKAAITNISKIYVENSHLKLMNTLSADSFKTAFSNSIKYNFLDNNLISISHSFDDLSRHLLFFFLLIEFNSYNSLNSNNFDLLYYGINTVR